MDANLSLEIDIILKEADLDEPHVDILQSGSGPRHWAAFVVRSHFTNTDSYHGSGFVTRNTESVTLQCL